MRNLMNYLTKQWYSTAHRGNGRLVLFSIQKIPTRDLCSCFDTCIRIKMSFGPILFIFFLFLICLLWDKMTMFRPRNLKCSILLLSIKICINTAININWFLPGRKKQIVIDEFSLRKNKCIIYLQ